MFASLETKLNVTFSDKRTASTLRRLEDSPKRKSSNVGQSKKSSRFDRFRDRSTEEEDDDLDDDIDLNDEEKEEKEIERRRQQRKQLYERIQKENANSNSALETMDDTSNDRTNLSSLAMGSNHNGNDSNNSTNAADADSLSITVEGEAGQKGPTTFESILKNNSQLEEAKSEEPTVVTIKETKADSSKQFDMFADHDDSFQVERNNDHSRNNVETHPSLIDNWDDSEGYYRKSAI